MNELFEFKKNALLGSISGEPLCDEYKKEWGKCGADKAALMQLVLRQQSLPFFFTACYKGLGLTKEYVKENFGEYINGFTVRDADGVEGYTYGLYVDYSFDNDLIADKNVCSLMWCDKTNVVVRESKCPTLYVSNKSHISVSGDGYNSIRIYLFDESSVILEDFDENSSVLIYKYSEDANVETGKYCLGKVKVFNKELKI